MLADKLKTLLPALLLLLAGFILAYQFVDPAPPSHITIATGQPDGAYARFASQLKEQLAHQGITADIQYSAGSLDNIARLQQGKADIAYVQSGLADNSSGLESLGSMYDEPLWIFLANGVHATLLRDMKGLRLATGQSGSGSYALASMLLNENGVSTDNSHWLPLPPDEAATALITGKADVAFMVGAATSAAIARLASARDIRLMNMIRADAYTLRHRTLSTLLLPRGTLNPAEDLPATDTRLLAPAATLLVNPSLHPALQDLVLQAAATIHGAGNLFSPAGAFPSAYRSGLPLSHSAERYYRSGPTFLQRYLPFWAATMVDRLKVMLLPFIALLIPLIKVMPPLYRWQVRSRIYRWYGKIADIDHALSAELSIEQLHSLVAELEHLEDEVRKIRVPLSYADELYDLRLHLALVQQQIDKARSK
ncbi:TAXI family TRAP transporter solute-binding subunit [Mariprofundus erugo]|uniref:TAXI family TRAP transporter solute-binding subunit n=1 Tax=Mariprofundus erugo TaxID=2528639 RepID=UPI0010FF5DE6|nr:TAXI family TRAP transporter solute-binding subunit [Mariprofundus erugo]TLS76867.1 TAXI family TRAP transporter solute-binding subunit [Mariprofundus erugo]